MSPTEEGRTVQTTGNGASNEGDLPIPEPAAGPDQPLPPAPPPPPLPEALDWSEVETQELDAKAPRLGQDYDPRPKEDEARRYIAYLLIGLLWVVVAGILILISFRKLAVAEIKEFAVVLGPVVTLVSAATGFYYGTKSK